MHKLIAFGLILLVIISKMVKIRAKEPASLAHTCIKTLTILRL